MSSAQTLQAAVLRQHNTWNVNVGNYPTGMTVVSENGYQRLPYKSNADSMLQTLIIPSVPWNAIYIQSPNPDYAEIWFVI